MKQKPDYANWIPKKLPQLAGGISAVACLMFLVSFLLAGNVMLTIVRVVLLLLALLFGFFFFNHIYR